MPQSLAQQRETVFDLRQVGGAVVDRKPAQTLAFAGVKPGYKIGDYAAGAGYFTRLFAGVVGPAGHVYASVPSGLFKYPNIVKGIADIETYTVTHPNPIHAFSLR